MPDVTTFMQISYPSEYQDPFWETWTAFVSKIDEQIYMNKVMNNFILSGGGTIAFSSSTGVLSWTQDFVIPYLEYGYKILIKYGPDGAARQATLSDGEALIIEIPFAITQDAEVNAQVTNQLAPAGYDKWVVGYRKGSNFYFRDRSV